LSTATARPLLAITSSLQFDHRGQSDPSRFPKRADPKNGACLAGLIVVQVVLHYDLEYFDSDVGS
jgi:hypothetical protein